MRAEQVQFNGSESSSTKVIVSVGGQGIDYTNCYIQQHYAIPIIACLDPATVFRDPINKVFILCALHKAAQIDNGHKSPEKIDERDVLIPKDVDEARDALAPLTKASYLSVDIECNIKTKELTCIGFATHERAVVIPLQHEDTSYWSEDQEIMIWKLIAKILSSDQTKLFQNFIFDTMVLSRLGLAVEGRIEDTMTLAHTIQPELPKGLGDLARFWLYVAPWKSVASWRSHYDLWFYNGQDAIYTARIYEAMRASLTKETFIDSRLELYDRQLAPLHTEVLRICERGLNIDKEAWAALTLETQTKVDQLTAELRSLTDGLLPPKIEFVERKGSLKGKRDRDYYCLVDSEYQQVAIPEEIKMLKKMPFPIFERLVDDSPFNPASPDQVKDVIRALGHVIPKKRDPKTGEFKETADSLALKKLMFKHKHPFYRALSAHRKQNKILTTYCHMTLDPDGRLRFVYTVPGTVLSRFSSSQTAWDTGCNIQNIPRSFRRMIVPDYADWIIVNVDLKQADPHVVAWLAGEQGMLTIMDSGGDLHAHTGSAIAGRDITKDPNYDKETSLDRKLGKEANNALNYGMQANRFMDRIFDRLGIVISAAQAELARRSYFNLYPAIEDWHDAIESQINKTRTLKTPFGRERYFYDRLDPKLLNDARAYIPPTTVSDALNEGWLMFSKLKMGLRCDVLQQCHDSLMVQCHKDDLDRVATLLVECIEEVLFECGGKTRHFEADVSWGQNWGQLEGWRVKRA